MKKHLVPLILVSLLGTGSMGAASVPQTCAELLDLLQTEIEFAEDGAQRAQLRDFLARAERAARTGNEAACIAATKKGLDEIE